MFKIILITVVLMAFVFLALGVSIFFRRNGKFPETEVGKNKKMREMGITCVKCEEYRNWQNTKKKIPVKIRPNELKLDLSR